MDGILCENEAPARLAHRAESKTSTTLLYYLDVWQQPITASHDPSIREVALGGLDTSTREKTEWQVRPLVVHSEMPSNTDDLTYEHILALPEWRELVERSTRKPLMKARRKSSAYALDNRLYRVEIHHVRENTATFKWSRENGLVVFEVEKVKPVEEPGRTEWLVTLGDMGRDKTRLQKGDRVQVITAETEPAEHVIQLFEVIDLPDFTHRQIRLAGDPHHRGIPAEHPAHGMLLQRWDHRSGSSVMLDAGAVLLEENKWIELEAGIEIQFEHGHYHEGDYWLIPARTLTGDIEWPRAANEPAARPPDGIQHHQCPLALVAESGDEWRVVHDLRRLYDPLPVVSTRSLDRRETQVVVENPEPPHYLSEVCKSDQELEEGDVVALSLLDEMQVMKANADNGALVLGVVVEETTSRDHYRVVTYGRAKCKVAGPVAAGELLTVSSLDGFARKVNVGDELFRPGMILGKALETYEPVESREVVLVSAWISLG